MVSYEQGYHTSRLPRTGLIIQLLSIIIISSTSFTLNSFLIWTINYVVIVMPSTYAQCNYSC